MKPAIILLKLCPDKEIAKKFMMLSRANTLNNCSMLYIMLVYCIRKKRGTPLNNYNKRNK